MIEDLGKEGRVMTFLRVNRWLIIGVFLITIAAFLSVQYIHSTVNQAIDKRHQSTLQIFVANHAIAAYSPVTAAMVTAIRLPPSAVPPGAYTSVTNLAGAWTTEPIAAGIPIVSSEVFFPSTANVLAARINAHDMAVDVPLTADAAVDGLIMPGDQIALFLNITQGNHRVLEDFMNHVTVLAVNGSMVPASSSTVGKNLSLILALSPTETEKLLLATESGGLVAALESPNTVAKQPSPYTSSEMDTPIP
ncbi:Flp pilus assembly protein CpaB [Sulfoacidibacillus thermotolerans]|nr:Flp pilus assembly protein CpaB [Sulfoacidibacillus thermotolerans]